MPINKYSQLMYDICHFANLNIQNIKFSRCTQSQHFKNQYAHIPRYVSTKHHLNTLSHRPYMTTCARPSQFWLFIKSAMMTTDYYSNPENPGSERPQIYAWDRAATGTGCIIYQTSDDNNNNTHHEGDRWRRVAFVAKTSSRKFSPRW